MKLATSLATLSLFACTAAFAVSPTQNTDLSLDDQKAIKDAQVFGVPVPGPRVGGEDVGSAVNVPALPYSDGGNTCTFADDYDEACPFTGSLAPDVVYSYTPGADGAIDIAVCASLYDTKLFVYENAATPGLPYACNDDACGDDGFKSELVGVPVTTGNTYYIVIDGYNSDCGDYSLEISENVPCIVDCPTGSVLEGEVDCFDDYDDFYNAGCNQTPNLFTNVPCANDGNVTVCGTYGGYFHSPSGFNYRDTDWYALDPAANTAGVTVCVSGEYETLIGSIDASLGCGAPAFFESAVVGPCDTGCLNVPAGAWWVFVGTSTFGVDAGACGGAYTMDVSGYTCPPVSVEAATWSDIKGKHR